MRNRNRQGNAPYPYPPMVGQLQLRVVDAIEFPEHFDKIGLPPEHMARRNAGSGPEGPPAQMLGVEDPLGLDQLVIKS